jgi:hypothetical protein
MNLIVVIIIISAVMALPTMVLVEIAFRGLPIDAIEYRNSLVLPSIVPSVAIIVPVCGLKDDAAIGGAARASQKRTYWLATSRRRPADSDLQEHEERGVEIH